MSGTLTTNSNWANPAHAEDAACPLDAEPGFCGLPPARDDDLTHLLSRAAFHEALMQRFSSLREGEEFALLLLALDRFRTVNETLGHDIGDEVLRAVAHRLQHTIRQSDRVGRLGGDEFAVLQTSGRQPVASRMLAHRIIDLLREPFFIGGQTIHVGVSIGGVVAPYDADSAESLLRGAGLALCRSKKNGGNVLRYFEPAMEAQIQKRRWVHQELVHAIANEQFEMHFQPIQDLRSNRIVTFEALVRWNHPTLGLVPPDQFIPLAEESELIVPLGHWVLRSSCLEAGRWSDDIRLAVNLSPVQLRDRNLVKSVVAALEVSGLPANRLELEITETALISSTELSIGMLHQLREMGVEIAMDDFGTGYSSINYLRRFPFDKIKIDRSFVSGSDRDEESSAIVRMIASLGMTLGVKTTAEGVETEDEMKSVRRAGCTEMQGYLLSRPIPASEIGQILGNHSTIMATR